MPTSVEQLGDIYVVTVDKSGSMRNSRIIQSALNRLPKALKDVDYSKDAFIFFTSGFVSKKNCDETQVKELWRREQSFQEGFIHQTTGKIHRFKESRDVVRFLRNRRFLDPTEPQLASFCYQQSYVSQIRVSALVRALDLIKKLGVERSFNSINIISITDDACQNDQWAIDYRRLKAVAPDKLDSISKLNSKYIYTALNPGGAGELLESYSDESAIPHIWLYKYQSRQALADTLTDFRLKVKAVDGKNIELSAKQNSYRGDAISFFHIDSICVNGTSKRFDVDMLDTATLEMEYDNRFSRNNVEIFGFMQVEYKDDVYGPHYKRVEIAQQGLVLSGKQSLALEWLIVLLLVALVGTILYLLLVRPYKKIAHFYLSNGMVVKLRRGFTSAWKERFIPVLCCLDDNQVIVRRHRCIKRTSSNLRGSKTDGMELLIDSSRPLNLPATHYDLVGMDRYFEVVGENNPMLQDLYQKTLYSKVAAWSMAERFEWIQRWLLKLINIFFPHHYYYINNLSDDLFFSSPMHSNIHYGVQVAPTPQRDSLTNFAVAQALDDYYKQSKGKACDVLLCVQSLSKSVAWNLVLLSNADNPEQKLNEVRCLLSYTTVVGERPQSEEEIDKDIKFVLKNLKQDPALKRILSGKKIEVLKHGAANATVTDTVFNIVDVKCPGYVYFVEDTEKKRSQLFYSSVEDDKNGRYVAIAGNLQNGWLYLSLLPFNIVKDRPHLYKKMSTTVVRTADKSLSPVRFEGKTLYYKGETYKLEN